MNLTTSRSRLAVYRSLGGLVEEQRMTAPAELADRPKSQTQDTDNARRSGNDALACPVGTMLPGELPDSRVSSRIRMKDPLDELIARESKRISAVVLTDAMPSPCFPGAPLLLVESTRRRALADIFTQSMFGSAPSQPARPTTTPRAPMTDPDDALEARPAHRSRTGKAKKQTRTAAKKRTSGSTADAHSSGGTKKPPQDPANGHAIATPGDEHRPSWLHCHLAEVEKFIGSTLEKIVHTCDRIGKPWTCVFMILLLGFSALALFELKDIILGGYELIQHILATIAVGVGLWSARQRLRHHYRDQRRFTHVLCT